MKDCKIKEALDSIRQSLIHIKESFEVLVEILEDQRKENERTG